MRVVLAIVLICFHHRTFAGKCVAGLDQLLGYTYPSGDITVEYGNPLEITCVIEKEPTIKLDGNTSEHLQFTLNKTNLYDKIEILNSTSIKLYDPHVPKGSHFYYCMYNTNEIVCQNKVIVGTKPQDVKNFNCIGMYLENLTCSWEYPENYVKTNYSLQYWFPGSAGRGKFSPPTPPEEYIDERGVKKMRCIWTMDTIPHYRQSLEIYYFLLKMSNVLGNHSMKEYTFHHYENVKAAPPEKLEKVNATVNSIYLTWTVPLYFVNYALNARILYQCLSQPEPKKWILADVIYLKDGVYGFYNLTGLYSYDLCDIRVSLRMNQSKIEEMWSNNASITERSESSLPGAFPLTNIGSFQTKVSNHPKQDIFIYWQQIPDDTKNGDNFTYVVELLGDSSRKHASSTNSFVEFKELFIYEEYKFAIWAENSMGKSVNKSFVTVPSRSNRPAEIQDLIKIAYENGTYELNFKPPTDVNIKNLTIFWCKNDRDPPYQCTGFLNWTEVPADTTRFIIAVPDTSAFWQFAVTANTDSYSSGMVWALCTLLHGQSIGKIKGLNKSGNASPTSIELVWKHLDCTDRIPTIEGYVIYYCPFDYSTQSCNTSEQNVTITGDSSTTRANITGLKPYTTYQFHVAMKTKYGDISELSDPVSDSTLEGVPSEPLNLRAIAVTNSSITIKWDPPLEINGKLRYYYVQYGRFMEKVDHTTEFIIDKLESFKRFNITVTACIISCSKPSATLSVVTKMGAPGTLNQPIITKNNTIAWEKPAIVNGIIDHYEIQMWEEGSKYKNKPEIVNGTQYKIEDCGEGGKHNIVQFSVRAVNRIEGRAVHGNWSTPITHNCSNPANTLIWTLLGLGTIMLLIAAFVVQRTLQHCKTMKNVELKLPPGLAPIQDWGNPKIPEEQENAPSADEQLLLEKIPSAPSVESSGCCSGHGSVGSDSGTTISSTSADSGTEQNELRKRSKNTSSADLPAIRLASTGPGYVAMPTEALGKPRVKPATGNYCVLGVDPGTNLEGDVPRTPQLMVPPVKLPYVSCDAMSSPSPYVLTGDVVGVKPSGMTGYVPVGYPDPEKNPAYVMAGTRGVAPDQATRPMQEESRPAYVQVSDALLKHPQQESTQWPRPPEPSVPKGYVTIGEAVAVAKHSGADVKKGYVPHRHLDAKFLKED